MICPKCGSGAATRDGCPECEIREREDDDRRPTVIVEESPNGLYTLTVGTDVIEVEGKGRSAEDVADEFRARLDGLGHVIKVEARARPRAPRRTAVQRMLDAEVFARRARLDVLVERARSIAERDNRRLARAAESLRRLQGLVPDAALDACYRAIEERVAFEEGQP